MSKHTQAGYTKVIFSHSTSAKTRRRPKITDYRRFWQILVKNHCRFIAGGFKALLIFFCTNCINIDSSNNFVIASFLPEVSKVKERQLNFSLRKSGRGFGWIHSWGEIFQQNRWFNKKDIRAKVMDIVARSILFFITQPRKWFCFQILRYSCLFFIPPRTFHFKDIFGPHSFNLIWNFFTYIVQLLR